LTLGSGEAAKIQGVLRLAAFQAADLDVTDDGIELAGIAFFLIEVAQIDVLNDTAADGVRFDAQDSVLVGALQPAVFGEDIADTAGDFAADGDGSVAVLHGAIANDDVLAGCGNAAAVAIAARLDGDAVVAGIEEAIL